VHGANTFAGTDLDLRRVAWAIDVMRQTGVAIRAAAHELGLQPSGSHRGELLSFSYVAHRMILTRLGAHEVCRRPEPVPYLVWLGLVALARRQDISTLLKGMMAVWLLAMAAAPRPWAHWLARSLLLSENRPRFVNQLLRIGHGWHARARRVVRSSRISKEVAAIAILADRG
jgi:hypothetical protein